MQKFSKNLREYSFLSNLKTYLFLILLAFSTEGWCGRQCLNLCDEEIESKQVARVFRHINDFFKENETVILNLEKQEPGMVRAIGLGKKISYVFSKDTKKTFHEMITKKTTYIGEDYTDNPELLRTHLEQIKNVISKDEPSDLIKERTNILKGYINLLLFLSKF